jgi:hypothetical protein
VQIDKCSIARWDHKKLWFPNNNSEGQAIQKELTIL